MSSASETLQLGKRRLHASTVSDQRDEPLSGWRPPGYPTGTIGHFVAIVGYDTTADKVLIADPAGAGAPSPRWINVPMSYWITMHDLGTWVGARGYTGS